MNKIKNNEYDLLLDYEIINNLLVCLFKNDFISVILINEMKFDKVQNNIQINNVRFHV